MSNDKRNRRAEVRRRRDNAVPRTAMFARCLAIAEDYMMAHSAYGYPNREVVELACIEYGNSAWPEHGLVLAGNAPGYDPDTAAAFMLYAQKAVYEWKRTDKRKSGGPCAKFEMLQADRGARDSVLGMWVGRPEARLLELQRVVARNRGTDDKTVVSALRAAGEMRVETAPTAMVDAVRTLVDVAADKRQMFIVHMPKPKQPKT